MKILQINIMYPNGSTGKICNGIHQKCLENGITDVVAVAEYSGKDDSVIGISDWMDHHVHNRLARITMLEGLFSVLHTRFFLKKIKIYRPDIIHIHNIHGNYINIPMLVHFINKYNIRTIATTHDCWLATGYCKHFIINNCYKWKSECFYCPAHRNDPINRFDNSKFMFHKKKKLFTSIQDFTLVTPSQWIKQIFKESYLSKCKMISIENGIDLNVFKPVSSNFKQLHGISGKIMILGVAFDWGYRKGLDVFIEMSKRLDFEYAIVLVGTNEKIDMSLPENIISIHRTNSKEELAAIYSAADIFVNPTREEMFGMVNIESLACGTPVVTFNTGGSPECIDANTGKVVAVNDIDSLEKTIRDMKGYKEVHSQDCIERAKLFDEKIKYQDYINLYLNKEITHE